MILCISEMNEFGLYVKAASFAAEAHGSQMRKTDGKTIPYITHPLRVAERMRMAGVTNEGVLCAAVLHDVVEDTPVPLSAVRAEFGNDIARWVAEVTDDKSLPKTSRKLAQIEHAPHMSPESRLVKLADKIDNLSCFATGTPKGWDQGRVTGYFVWAQAVVDAMPEAASDPERNLRSQLKKLFDDNIPADLDKKLGLQTYLDALPAM
jgi:guanosine-3',5'-bis(diphosphate) 3'-pyrophosphohydrolase